MLNHLTDEDTLMLESLEDKIDSDTILIAMRDGDFKCMKFGIGMPNLDYCFDSTHKKTLQDKIKFKEGKDNCVDLLSKTKWCGEKHFDNERKFKRILFFRKRITLNVNENSFKVVDNNLFHFIGDTSKKISSLRFYSYCFYTSEYQGHFLFAFRDEVRYHQEFVHFDPGTNKYYLYVDNYFNGIRIYCIDLFNPEKYYIKEIERDRVIDITVIKEKIFLCSTKTIESLRLPFPLKTGIIKTLDKGVIDDPLFKQSK